MYATELPKLQALCGNLAHGSVGAFVPGRPVSKSPGCALPCQRDLVWKAADSFSADLRCFWLVFAGSLACRPKHEIAVELLTHERNLSFIKTVEKVPVTTVVLIKCPGFDREPIFDRLVDQLQSDLALGEKRDVSWNMCFFRRV